MQFLILKPIAQLGITEEQVKQAAVVLQQRLHLQNVIPMTFGLGDLIPNAIPHFQLTEAWLDGEGDDMRLWGNCEPIPKLNELDDYSVNRIDPSKLIDLPQVWNPVKEL